MKTTRPKFLMFVLLLLSTLELSAFYDPNLQRWPNRDPLEEAGFELFLGGGSFPGSAGQNLYAFVRNSPITGTDPLGLCDIKIRCGPVKRGGITVGRHCGVIAPDGSEYGLGGGDKSSGSSGTANTYHNPSGDPGANQKEYPVSCPCKSCDEVKQSLQSYHDTETPPPYNALGPNSNTYAHKMLDAAGCSVDPISRPPVLRSPKDGGPTERPPRTTPPGTIGW